MLSGDDFPTECYVTTLTQISTFGADIATSPIVITSIVTVISQSPGCGLIVTRRGVSQGKGRAAQQQQQEEEHPGVRREEHQEHQEPSSGQISQGPGG